MLEETVSALSPYLHQYGVVGLFVLLALGIVALPIPDESLLVLAGWLVAKGTFSAFPTILAAVAEAWCGMSISYFLGCKLGQKFGHRLSRFVGLGPERVKKAQNWFHRIGKWSLVLGYFIPGVRRLVGYFAGALSLPYRQFALLSYSGGCLWALVFICVGYFFQCLA